MTARRPRSRRADSKPPRTGVEGGIPESRPRGPAVRLAGAAALALIPAGLFYGYHLLTNSRFLLGHFERGALSATSLPASATAVKLGFTEFAQLGAQGRAAEAPLQSYILDSLVQGNAFPVVAYYVPGASILSGEQVPAAPDGRLRVPAGTADFLFFTSPNEQGAPGVEVFSRTRYGLTLFGVTLASAHPNPNFFRQGRYVVTRTGPPWDFGFTGLRTYSALAAARLSRGRGAYRTKTGIELREDASLQDGSGGLLQ